MNMSVENGKKKVLFVCRCVYLMTRVVTRKSDLSFPGGELVHGETEGLIVECIHTIWGANNSKVLKITTSNCMRRNHDRVLITHTRFHMSAFHLEKC